MRCLCQYGAEQTMLKESGDKWSDVKTSLGDYEWLDHSITAYRQIAEKGN